MSQQLPESSEKTIRQASRRETQPASVHSFQAGLHPILQLQRTLGNRRVAQLIQARRLTPEGGIIGLQPKLTVRAADDRYEQEADHVARQVVSMPDSAVPASSPQTSSVDGGPSQIRTLQSKPLPSAASITSFVQRQIGAKEESEKDQNREEAKDELLQAKFFNKSAALPLQRQTAVEGKKIDSIQPKSAGSLSDSFEAGEDVESRLNQSKGGGSQLPDHVRAYMEPRFDTDLNTVRIHTDMHATESAREMNALAFTVGRNDVFGAGQYAHRTMEGRKLLAHELTHTIQQGSLAAHADTFVRLRPTIPAKNVGESLLPIPYPVTHQVQRQHDPGGPYHPPEGTSLRCTAADSCSSLSLKINYLRHTIRRHIEWDIANPNPAYPGGRHAQEIVELQNGLANCIELHQIRCTRQPEVVPVPVPLPVPDPAAVRRIATATAIGAGIGVVAGAIIGAIGGGAGGTLVAPGVGTVGGGVAGGVAGATEGGAIGGLVGGAVMGGAQALWEWLSD